MISSSVSLLFLFASGGTDRFNFWIPRSIVNDIKIIVAIVWSPKVYRNSLGCSEVSRVVRNVDNLLL